MNAAESMASPVRPLDARRVRRASVFGNLLRKELRESTGAIVAGLVVYWVLPAVLELVYVAIDPRHELLTGFAWFLILSTGWLYAIVVGAHTVCRDWGRPEEHFLLARPVSPRTVVWAKLLVGIAVVTVVVLVGCLWDWLLAAFSPTGIGGSILAREEYAWIWVVLGCTMAISFVMAFAVAVLSRQMLPSVLVPSLILTIWSTAPLVSRRLAFLCPPQMMGQNLGTDGSGSMPLWMGPLTNTWFAVAVGACIVASLATALLTCTRERVIRLGHKPLAWAIALVVLVLFAAAMDEVGNSLTVRDQYAFAGPDHPGREAPGGGTIATASCGDRFAILSKRYFPVPGEHQGDGQEKSGWDFDQSLLLTEFRVDDEGRIQERREAELSFLSRDECRRLWNPDKYPRPGPRSALTELLLRDWPTKLVLVEGAPTHVILGGVARDGDAVLRVTLVWPEHRRPEVASEASVPTPLDANLTWPVQHLMTARFSYLSYLMRPPEDQPKNWLRLPQMLLVVDWADESNPQVRYTIPLPANTNISLKQECLVFSRADYSSNWTNIEDSEIEAVPLDDPEVLAELQANPSDLFKPGPNAWWRAVQPFRLGELQGVARADHSAWALGKNGILYLSDVLGLRVFGPETLGTRPVIGNYWRSPLSMLLTDYWSWPSLYNQYSDGSPTQLYGDSLLIESGLTAYDVSDPARPQRVGYFNAAPDAHILATPHHLVLCEGSLVTVIDRPGP